MKQLIFKETYHSIKNSIYEVGTTNRNEFYPVYASLEKLRVLGFANSDTFSKHIIDGIYSYHKPIYCNGINIRGFSLITNFNSLMSAFQGYNSMSVLRFKVGEDTFYINVTGGYIADTEGNILLVLCAKSSTISSVANIMTTDNIVDDNQNYHTNNLRLLVATEFFKEEKYKNIYKRIEKEIIQSCYEMGIDVMFTTSKKIEESLFKNDFEIEFQSITELHEHLQSGIGRTYFFNETDFQRREELEDVLEELDELVEPNGIQEQIENVTFAQEPLDSLSFDNSSNIYVSGFDPISDNNIFYTRTPSEDDI